MNILIFSPKYPDKKHSTYQFVKELVDEWAEQGHNCTVVATYSITSNRGFYPFKTVEEHAGGGRVTILRPNIPTFSELSLCGVEMTLEIQRLAIKWALKAIDEPQDVVYCHFWQSGADGYLYANKHNTPLFIATGESDVKRLFREKIDRKFLSMVKGVVCVSSKNRDESIALGLTTAEKCGVFPNAVDLNLFHKMDKAECRRQLGFPEDAFITITVGAFKETKGVARMSEALNMIEDKDVHSVFVGSGSVRPYANNMIFCDKLMHSDVPLYLNAADVFVLPTLAEGCCNAIIEAMACGVPVISSNLSFNHDVLNDTNSILIDPTDSHQIKDAILALKSDHTLRQRLAEGALRTAEALNISQRASNVLAFINEMIKK